MSNFTKITQANQKEFLETLSDSLVVLFFDAPFTDQEQLVNAAIESLQSTEDIKDKIVIGLVNVEETNDLANELDVHSVPAVLCRYKGKVVRRIDTLEKSNLGQTIREELKKLSILSGVKGEVELSEKDRFREYLQKLTNRHNVMIFMKGNPEQPRCGFSKQMMELLGNYKVEFGTFDILLDEQVRQGLKEYSDWPTYPQIYVKGEFVGGLDILKQLHQGGELEKTLSP